MKNIILILFISIISCNKEKTLTEQTTLKEIPAAFFKINSTHDIRIKNDTIKYTNKFERLPNTEFSKFYLKKHPDTFIPFFNITLNLNKEKKITFEGVEIYKDELISYLKEYIDFAANDKPALIHLNFDENITLKDFIAFISFIEVIQSNTIKLNNKVYIYDINMLPNCDCSL